MAPLVSERRRLFRYLREAPMLLLLLVLLADLLFNRLYLSFFHYPLDALLDISRGVVVPLVSLSFIKLIFIVAGLIFWIGHFRPRDLGLWGRNVPAGILTTLFLWAALEMSMLVASFLIQGYIRFSDNMAGLTPVWTLVGFLLFALCKALFDETVYRGLLLPQFHTKLVRYVPLSAGANLILAVLLSQLVYVIIQVPLIDFGEGNEYQLTSALASVIALSLLNALLFLRTKNLYIPVAVHALWYHTAFMADTDFPPRIALATLAVLLLVLWPLLPDRRTVLYAQPLEDQTLY